MARTKQTARIYTGGGKPSSALPPLKSPAPTVAEKAPVVSEVNPLPPLKTGLPPLKSPASVVAEKLPPVSGPLPEKIPLPLSPRVPSAAVALAPLTPKVPSASLPPLSPRVASPKVPSASLAPLSPRVASPKVPSASLAPLSPRVASPKLPSATVALPHLTPKAPSATVALPALSPRVPSATVAPKIPSEKVSLPPPEVSEKEEFKAPLPVKKALPPLAPKTGGLPPLAPKAEALKPVPKVGGLPPLVPKAGGLPLLTKPVTKKVDAKEIREHKKELVQEMTKEAEKKEEIQKGTLKPLKALVPVVSGVSPALLQPLKPLTSKPVEKEVPTLKPAKELPKLVSKLPTAPEAAEKSVLEIAQEGVSIALPAEPQAHFQPKSFAPSVAGLVAPLPTKGDMPISLATIASPANLPSKRSTEKTPKIKIPKITSSAVKPSPKKRVEPTFTAGIALPASTTIIAPLPITSPSTIPISKVSTVQTPSAELMKNIMSIDVNKLKAEKVNGKEAGYNVNELKTISGSLGLTKTGNKRELVNRIKEAILKVNPNAFD